MSRDWIERLLDVRRVAAIAGPLTQIETVPRQKYPLDGEGRLNAPEKSGCRSLPPGTIDPLFATGAWNRSGDAYSWECADEEVYAGAVAIA
ncbi:hypothetical protein RB1514 [Rhodopirellula baltica SH 1]|uniref:Uncharacterized protein n=1 Tax=Rhodopirellula baltica (strain DSM 10527 / NCIMB 13988 / SH1) TaxID=243090 RepID=Q7UX75_RHOBA|nr:hypothetical protein RB1514 [Rhodopirellula baltica SH 1]